MTLSEEEKQVKDILELPIICDKSIVGKPLRRKNLIYTGQTYRGQEDADMSDFAVAFYKIVYSDLLEHNDKNEIVFLNSKKGIYNSDFAGDTMNSFNTFINGQKSCNWSNELWRYFDSYHCLANFWVIPMKYGRSLAGKYNKAKKPISDYMDKYLKVIHDNINFDHNKDDYWSKFNSWPDFVNRHYLLYTYVNKNGDVLQYSDKYFLKGAENRIKGRAFMIAKAKGNELYDYFRNCKLI